MIIQYPKVSNRNEFTQHTADDILSLIKSPKQYVLEAIRYFRYTLSHNPLYKANYKKERIDNVPAIQWNKTQAGDSSSFIYFDFDYSSVDEALSAQERFIKNWGGGIYACWKSLSGTGLGVLFQSDSEINEEQFLKLYDWLTEELKKEGFNPDPKRRDFSSVNFLSYDADIVIKRNSIKTKDILADWEEKQLSNSKERKETLAEKQHKEFSSTLILKSQYGWRPKEYIKAKAKDAKHLEINFFASIKVGNRGNTYSAVATKLFRLNPQPEKLNEIKKVIVWLNNNRAEKPWDNTEVQHFVDNIEIHKKGKAISSKKVVIKNPTYSELLNVFDQVNKINLKSMEQTIVNIVQRADNELKINKAVKGGAKTLNDIYKNTGISKTTITKYYKSQGKQYSEQLAISDVKDVVKQLNEFIHELIQANNEALAA
ncbi:MAG: hypothetical protein BGO31_19710 [Bacteroidetes bacterium 43-16]|uniref:hypothetical protein n=1 Tax=uncultured Flavobacterium sp. TaxID=165435 RepID=UPI00092A8D14|nr:hypothetical protein [uncultured Flavobacterium sp.]OJV55584.1 MAG: hypothetical protein BGO31_19710 [Bacteroidetes bacterium 43-16]